jgi:hypothetical protein
MYVNPVFFGVMATIFVEVFIILGVLIFFGGNGKK